jgi:hypothetical protein
MKIELLNSNGLLQKVKTIGDFNDISETLYPDTHYIKILEIDIPLCKAQFLTNTEREFDIQISFRDEYKWIRVDISNIKNNKSKLKTLLNIIYKHSC